MTTANPFDAYFATLRGKLFAVARRILSHEDAEDVVQVVALEVLREWQAGKINTVSFWASRTSWKSIDLRRRNLKFLSLEELPDDMESAQGNITPCMCEDGMLRFIAEGYTVKEVAEITGVSRWTIYRRLRVIAQDEREKTKRAAQPRGHVSQLHILERGVGAQPPPGIGSFPHPHPTKGPPPTRSDNSTG